MDVMRINSESIISDKKYNVGNEKLTFFPSNNKAFESCVGNNLLKYSKTYRGSFDNTKKHNDCEFEKPTGLPPYIRRRKNINLYARDSFIIQDQLERIQQWNDSNYYSDAKNSSKPPMTPNQRRSKPTAWNRDDSQKRNSQPIDKNNNKNGSNNDLRNIKSPTQIGTLTRNNNKHSSSVDLTGFKRDSYLQPKPTYAQKCLEALNSVDNVANPKFSLNKKFGSTQSLNISTKLDFPDLSTKRSSYASSTNLKKIQSKNENAGREQFRSSGNKQNNAYAYSKTPNRYVNQPRSKSKKKYRNMNAPQQPKKAEPIVLGVTNKLHISCPVTPLDIDDFIEDDLKEYLSELKINSEFINDSQPFFNVHNLDDEKELNEDKPIVDMNSVIEKLQDPMLKTLEVKSTMSGNHLKSSRAVDKLFWDFA